MQFMKIEWIRAQLDLAGKSQKELGDHLGLTESQMSKIMSSGRKITASEADDVRRFFGYHVPGDPVKTDAARIQEAAPRLDARQARSLARYLEDLLDETEEHPRAS